MIEYTINKQTDKHHYVYINLNLKIEVLYGKIILFKFFFTHLHNCKQFFLDAKTEFTITLALRGTRARVCSAL